MKIKTLVAMLFLSAGATTVVAQDATNCNSNSSISHEAVRAGNFKDAYTPWKAVLDNCPTLRFYTFTDGYKILKGLMAQIKDKNSPEYKKYFDELMNTHDLRMKYTEEFLSKDIQYMLDCKMPDDGQEILVTNGETTWQDTCFIDSNGYYLDGGYDWIDIMAWMPLPKPYKEG